MSLFFLLKEEFFLNFKSYWIVFEAIIAQSCILRVLPWLTLSGKKLTISIWLIVAIASVVMYISSENFTSFISFQKNSFKKL